MSMKLLTLALCLACGFGIALAFQADIQKENVTHNPVRPSILEYQRAAMFGESPGSRGDSNPDAYDRNRQWEPDRRFEFGGPGGYPGPREYAREDSDRQEGPGATQYAPDRRPFASQSPYADDYPPQQQNNWELAQRDPRDQGPGSVMNDPRGGRQFAEPGQRRGPGERAGEFDEDRFAERRPERDDPRPPVGGRPERQDNFGPPQHRQGPEGPRFAGPGPRHEDGPHPMHDGPRFGGPEGRGEYGPPQYRQRPEGSRFAGPGPRHEDGPRPMHDGPRFGGPEGRGEYGPPQYRQRPEGSRFAGPGPRQFEGPHQFVRGHQFAGPRGYGNFRPQQHPWGPQGPWFTANGPHPMHGRPQFGAMHPISHGNFWQPQHFQHFAGFHQWGHHGGHAVGRWNRPHHAFGGFPFGRRSFPGQPGFGPHAGHLARRSGGPGMMGPQAGEVRRPFDRLDTNSDGKITKEEVLEVFSKADADADGTISREEFVKAIMSGATPRPKVEADHPAAKPDSHGGPGAAHEPPQGGVPGSPQQGFGRGPGGPGAGRQGRFGPGGGFGPGGFGGPGRPGMGPRETRVLNAFDLFDKENKGVLTKDDVPERVWDRISKADANGDGKVSKGELEAFRNANRPEPAAKPADSAQPADKPKEGKPAESNQPTEKPKEDKPATEPAVTLIEEGNLPADALTVLSQGT